MALPAIYSENANRPAAGPHTVLEALKLTSEYAPA